jgi:nucleoside-diphosphate-sugar epimerase
MDPLLIVGLGDIARRALPLLRPHFDISALVRSPDADAAGTVGLRVLCADLDRPETLRQLPASVTHVLHTAPPPNAGTQDPRTEALLTAMRSAPRAPTRIVYISTSGVYGDCGGALVDESRPVRPHSDRARRRVDAETRLAAYGAEAGCRIVILRAPGIYAPDRLPLRRLRNGTPVLRPEDDVYTNHVHAEDLAAMCARALLHPQAEGIYNACDDAALPMGAWFDLLADRAGLPRPPRIARSEAAAVIPAPLLSFMSESRRLLNARIKQQLGYVLRYPTVHDGVPAVVDASGA